MMRSRSTKIMEWYWRKYMSSIHHSLIFLPGSKKHGQSLHLHLDVETTAHTLQCCSAADMICSLQLCWLIVRIRRRAGACRAADLQTLQQCCQVLQIWRQEPPVWLLTNGPELGSLRASGTCSLSAVAVCWPASSRQPELLWTSWQQQWPHFYCTTNTF